MLGWLHADEYTDRQGEISPVFSPSWVFLISMLIARSCGLVGQDKDSSLSLLYISLSIFTPRFLINFGNCFSLSRKYDHFHVNDLP